MKVALVHDHLTQLGGAEQVLKAFQEIWPGAPIFVLLHDKRRAPQEFVGKDIRTSFLQRIPGSRKFYQWFLPFMPAATEHHNLDGFDVVLSSSSAFSKGVITRPESLHICYCHTPTRYLWSDTHTYVEGLPYNRLVKFFIPFLLSRLRLWDRLTSERVDHFIANSKTVAHRIQKYYGRVSDVIYPPVDAQNFHISQNIGTYYLAGGRLVPYKRFDLVVHAFNKLGIPLKIFGTGPEQKKLRTMAKPNIEFLGNISDAKRADLYANAIAFIHPQLEDFGITAIESMVAGRPVIAYGRGGATESVVPGVTGVFFDEQTWEAIGDAVIRFKPEQFNPVDIRNHALQFDREQFKRRIKSFVEDLYSKFSNEHKAENRLL